MNEVVRQVVRYAHEFGVGILRGFLTGDELAKLRKQFTRAYIDAGLGDEEPAKRVAVSDIWSEESFNGD